MDKVLEEFVRYKKIQGISDITIKNYLVPLRKLKAFNGKDFKDNTKEDLIRFLEFLESQNKYKERSILLHKVVLKTFYKWLEGDDEEYPKKVRWIKARHPKENPVIILTQEEVFSMIEVAENIRDKAMLCVLYDTGVRRGELLGMNIGDVELHEDYIDIYIRRSKTFTRPVAVVTGRQYLQMWLDSHPCKEDENAPLWIGYEKTTLCPQTISDILHKCAKKAGIKKNVTPHTFRRTCATRLKKLNEYELEEYMGWKFGSKMPRIYMRRSGKDAKDSVLKAKGIIPGEKEEMIKTDDQICSFCNTSNPPTAKFCYNCGKPLDIEIALREKKNVRYFTEMILKDPQIIKRMFDKRTFDLKRDTDK